MRRKYTTAREARTRRWQVTGPLGGAPRGLLRGRGRGVGWCPFAFTLSENENACQKLDATCTAARRSHYTQSHFFLTLKRTRPISESYLKNRKIGLQCTTVRQHVNVKNRKQSQCPKRKCTGWQKSRTGDGAKTQRRMRLCQSLLLNLHRTTNRIYPL